VVIEGMGMELFRWSRHGMGLGEVRRIESLEWENRGQAGPATVYLRGGEVGGSFKA
jgi:hypothetical protein